MILLDTNVISEMMRARPEPAVSAWLDRQLESELWTTSVVVAELLSGIDMMPEGRKQRVLREAVEGMIAEDFRDRILDFDLSAARHYGQVLATRRKVGHPIREFDAQIAAIARVHGADLATRDIDDFVACGLTVIDPWSEQS
jgi:toxin FitB